MVVTKMVAKTSNADVDIITPVVAAATAEVSIDDIIKKIHWLPYLLTPNFTLPFLSL